MIHFFTTDHHRYTIENFVESWMPEEREKIRVISYEKFSAWGKLPASVCIFTDMERLFPYENRLAIDLASALQKRADLYTVINAPGRYIGRFNLLTTLHQEGINNYRAVRVGSSYDGLRYPVFVRNAIDHKGPISGLLQTRQELEQELTRFRSAPRTREHLIVVEYCHSADSTGLFRKYSATNIGGKLIPRHILFSRDWSTKNADLVGDASVDEEADFVEKFPHAEQLRKIFQLAGVEYGRIDYGLVGGRVQVWEINTNPVIVPTREKIDPRRMPAQSRSARAIAAALNELSEKHAPSAAAPFRSFRFATHKGLQLFTRPWRQFRYGRRA